MSKTLSSVAHDDDLEPESGAYEADASSSMSARGLLSAAEIWATSSSAPAETPAQEQSAAGGGSAPAKPARARPSELLAKAKAACSYSGYPGVEPKIEAKTEAKSDGRAEAKAEAKMAGSRSTGLAPRSWPPQKLSLALQGGGTFAAFTWGVLDRLLEQPDLAIDAISGASAGAVNAVLLACGLAEGGAKAAQQRLAQFWSRLAHEASFRSLLLVGGFSSASSSVAFGPALRSGQFDPLDLDPLREALLRDIDFAALRSAQCPKLLIAATRVRDGRQQIFRNADITADVVLASACPPLVHSAVEISGEAYWDGGYGANPPLIRLVQETDAADLLAVQLTPSCDNTVPITPAAIDRRLDQIAANAALNAEIAALEWARDIATSLHGLRLHRISAEDEIEGLAQRSAADAGPNFMAQLRDRGQDAAHRWLRRDFDRTAPAPPERREVSASAMQSSLAEAALL